MSRSVDQFGTYEPSRCDFEPRWWVRDSGCSLIEGGLVRPRSVRLGLLELGLKEHKTLWRRSLNDEEEWKILGPDDEWNTRIEIFGGFIEGAGGGEGELLLLQSGVNPNDKLQFEMALLMFDTSLDSELSVFAFQPETDPCALAYVSPAWCDRVNELLDGFALRHYRKPYEQLRLYLRFSYVLQSMAAKGSR